VNIHPFHVRDVAAGCAANVALLAIATCAVAGVAIPDVLSFVAGSSVTWLFVRSVEVAKENAFHGS